MVALALAVGVVLLALRALVVDNPAVTLFTEEGYADVLVRAASPGRLDPDEPVVVVRFDERTFQALSLPFQELSGPMATLIEKLRDAGPRVIGFDMGFGFLEHKEQGRHFLDVVNRRRDVVFTSQIPTAAEPVVPLPRDVTALVTTTPLVTGFSNLTLPGLHALDVANRGGMIRAVPLRHARGARNYPSFALVLACRALGIEPEAAQISDESVNLVGHEVPLDRGVLHLDDPGPVGFVTVGMEAVLKGQIPAQVFRDRVVIVGSMYQPLGDYHQTAFGRTPGVHVQAAAVHTLLKRPAPHRVAWAAGALVLMACALVGLAFVLRPGPLALVFACALPLPLHLACVLAYAHGQWLPGAFALAAGPLTGFVLSRFGQPTAVAASHVTDRAMQTPSRADSGEDPIISVARASLHERYTNPRLIGRGGMGVVLAAQDIERGQEVAVKIVSPLLADEATVTRRFLREIRALQKLSHPGIVRILDVHETTRCPHYSMELVRGADLRHVLRKEQKLSVPRALDLFRQLFDVLAFVHDHGIVHRDIKPENIVIGDGDRVKLLDFGIAHLPEATAMTNEGQMLGTLRYMSPEQAEGRELGPPSDVFTAAMVCYEALTGRLPFPESGRILAFTQVPAPLSSACPEAGEELSVLLDECLRTPAEKRPATARHVLGRWPFVPTPEADLATI